MKKIPHPFMQMINKKIINIKRGEIDVYGDDEHVGEVYQFFFDDNTSLTVSLDDPGERCYAYIYEKPLDLNNPDLKLCTKLQDLSKYKVESYEDCEE